MKIQSIENPIIEEEVDELIIEETVEKLKSKTLTKTLAKEQKTTIVHCYIKWYMKMRIWPTTYLVDQENNKKYKLVSSFNIPLYPNWGNLPKGIDHFTLIFEGLNDECNSFRLIEEIPEPGEFRSNEIFRNRNDVYRIEL